MNLLNTTTTEKKFEKVMKSVQLSGQVEPYAKIWSEDYTPEYKLVDHQGAEYFIEASEEMKKSLSQCVWKKVKIIGTLRRNDLVLIPHKIVPHDSGADVDDVHREVAYRRRAFLRKVARTLNDFILVPLAVLVILAS